MSETDHQQQPLETSRAVHVSVMLLVMLFPTVTTYLYFVLLAGSESMQLVYALSKVVQFAFPLLWVMAVQRQRVRPAKPDWQSIGPGLAFGIAGVGLGLAVYFGYFKTSPYLQQAPVLIGGKVNDMGLTTPVSFMIFAAFLAVPHSLLEEYYWRWFTFGQLRRVIPVGMAVLISSLGFMAHHVIVIHQFLQGPWWMTAFFSLCVALGGGVWAWIYHRYRSLYGAWASHFLLDCGIMYIGYDLIPW